MDPDLLPRQKLIVLCLNVIGTMEMGLQQGALAALSELARCANGDECATTVTNEEIFELLKALESPCMAVREAALQVSLGSSVSSQSRSLDVVCHGKNAFFFFFTHYD